MYDVRLSKRKVHTLLKNLHVARKLAGTKNVLAESSLEVRTPMHEKIHELKQTLPYMEHEEHAQYGEKLDSVQQLLMNIAQKISSREERIDTLHASVQDMKTVVERIMVFEEEEKKTQLSARTRYLRQIEEQLAVFESRLADAAKRYADETLYPLRQKISDLKEKYRQLTEEKIEEVPSGVVAEEKKALAEELKQRIAELELPPHVAEAERRIEEEVQKIAEEIEAQEGSLELPDLVIPDEEELSLPSPFPELFMESLKEDQPPAPPQRKKGIFDTALGEVRKLLSRA